MEAARYPWPALGVLLIRDGLVSREELEEVLALQGDDRERRISSRRLGDALVESGIVTSAQVARLVAEQHELPFVDLEDSDASVPLAVQLPEELAREHSALPIRVFPDGSLLVVVADPTRTGCFDDIRSALGVPVRFAVAAPEAIEAAIDVASSRALLVDGREAKAAESSDGVTQGHEQGDDGEPPAYLVSELPDERPRHEAFAPAGERSRPVLGALLMRDGLVTEDELAAALAQQRLSSTRRLGEILVLRGTLAESDVARLVAEQHELPFIELSTYDIDLAAASLLPTDLAYVHAALPVARLPDGSLLVAVADPTSVMYADELREALGVPLEFAVAVHGEICDAIERIAEGVVTAPEAGDEERADEEQADEVELSDTSILSPAPTPLFRIALTPEPEDEAAAIRPEEPTRTAAETIEDALALGASAVHFTPRTEGLVVSARIDGLVKAITAISQPAVAVFANELDALAGRGGAVFVVGERHIETRSARIPTILGDRVTFRVLGERRGEPFFELLGTTSAETELRNALASRAGLFLVCGPIGSGLTTTLHAALRELDLSGRTVLTVEDPVEHVVPEAVQLEVSSLAGVTFATGLQSILRSDPDVVVVGELPDAETAQLAVRGARTALVLASTRAETAATGARRLLDLGVDPAVLGSTLVGVVAQRLVDAMCVECREPHYATPDEIAALGLPPEEAGRRLLGRSPGCAACDGTGSCGRVGVFEVLPLTDEIRRVLAGGASALEIEHAAVAAGMTTLRDGVTRLCLDGITSSAEVTTVTPHGMAAGEIRPFAG